jgi:hypothetical protein
MNLSKGEKLVQLAKVIETGEVLLEMALCRYTELES